MSSWTCYYLQAGCQSIVLSGGYEDDTDNGDTFYYTGYSQVSIQYLQLSVYGYHLIKKSTFCHLPRLCACLILILPYVQSTNYLKYDSVTYIHLQTWAECNTARNGR
jgi:hypothetical protein